MGTFQVSNERCNRVKKREAEHERSNKVYVDVLAEFSKDGLLIPKEITWEDGRKYEIT